LRVLVLTHRLPYAPNRGDRIRAYHLLRALASRHEVHLLSLVHDRDEADHAALLEGWLASVTTVLVRRGQSLVRSALGLFRSSPLTFTMLDAPQLEQTADRLVARTSPDVLVAYCSGMGRLLSVSRLAFLPAILDLVDVDSAKWAALGDAGRFPMSWIYRREARLLGRAETQMMRRASATTVVNDREALAARHLAGNAAIEVIGNGIDTAYFAPQAPAFGSTQVAFCGVMNYTPNAEAALFLAREVWPLVIAARPDARLALVGAQPTAAVTRLGRSPGITVTGSVSDVRPWLWSSAAAAAPIRTARGVQNKVLEAVSAGLPAVVSQQVADGLPEGIRPACLIADTARDCAAALIELLGMSAAERRRLAARASFAGLDWKDRLGPFLRLVDEVSGVVQGRQRASSA
jgi:sugar transferase (PEP-CTERM/EpsH1 system associated)